MNWTFWILRFLPCIYDEAIFNSLSLIILSLMYLFRTNLKQADICSIYLILSICINMTIEETAPYLFITTLCFAWSSWVYLRPEFSSIDNGNPYTIKLAFYKGTHDSFKMRFGELVGLPVKSLCVIAKDEALRIKDGVLAIVPAHTVSDSSNYFVIDTGVVATDQFMEHMLRYNGVKAKNTLISCPCTATIVALLEEISPYYKPSNILEFVPSIYLRKVLKHERRQKSNRFNR